MPARASSGRFGEAAQLALHAHAGQVDQAGRPYIGHPLRVAARLAPDEDAMTVGVLHDTVEDTSVTLDQIRRTFGDLVADAVDAVTHRPGESQGDYMARVRCDPLAVRAKRADMADNLDPARVALLDPDVAERLRHKYAAATRLLPG